MKHLVRHLLSFFLILLLSACGMPKAGFTGADKLAATQAKPKTQSKTTSKTTNDPTTNETQETPTQPQAESAACTNAKRRVGDLSSQCGSTLYNNSDVVPQSCVSAFSSLSTVTCGDLNAKVRAAVTACQSTFSQFSAYLPASCRSAIQNLGS